MKKVGSKDFYQVRKMSSISDLDRGYLIDLYLPLIGGLALASYDALAMDDTATDSSLIYNHEALFARLQVTPGQFEKALEALEATGLVRTYCKEAERSSYFVYSVYAPLDPKEFFEDPLFSGTLRTYIGNAAVGNLEKKYAAAEKVTDMEEVSMSFKDFFHPNLEDPIYATSPKPMLGHRNGKLRTGFDYRAFADELRSCGSNIEILSSREINRIEKLATLYDLDSAVMADMVIESTDPSRRRDSRVNFDVLAGKAGNAAPFKYLRQHVGEKSVISSSSALAQKIRMMDSVTPFRWLSLLQGGTKPSSSDMKLIQHLAFDIGLPNPVINALLDYVLQKNDNRLPSAYADKIAGALARTGVATARDAMEYLNSTYSRAKKAEEQKKDIDSEEAATQTAVKKETAEVSDEEFDAAINDIFSSLGK